MIFCFLNKVAIADAYIQRLKEAFALIPNDIKKENNEILQYI